MRRPRRRYAANPGMRVAEMLLFLAVSALGIFALGNGLQGLFESGKGGPLLWLALFAVTLWILFSQMGRVHDAWPRHGEVSQGRKLTPATRRYDRAFLRRLMRNEAARLGLVAPAEEREE
jgi:hypothetical protein